MFNAVGVISQAIKRNDHVFVDLEGVGVFGDGCRSGAIQPEFFARVRRHRDEAFTVTRIGEPHHCTGGFHRGVFIVRNNIANQYHFRPLIAPRFCGVTHRFQVALVQMFQSGKNGVLMAIQKVLDLDNRWHRLLDLSKEFQTHCANVPGHPMQDKPRGGDDAVAAFFLDARKSGEKFIGDVLAQAGFTKLCAWDFQYFFTFKFFAGLVKRADAKFRHVDIMNLAHVVIEPFDLHPFCVRRDHFPRREIVECGAPKHGFLAARIHRHVAADATRVSTRRIAGPHQARQLCGLHCALGHHTGFAADGRDGRGHAG